MPEGHGRRSPSRDIAGMSKPIAIFIKANPNHDRLGRFARAADAGGGSGGAHVPASSAEIKTEREAATYWRKHFANKTLGFLVPVSAKEHVRFSVRFSRDSDHAFTDHVLDGSGKKTGKRSCSPARAALMDHIEGTINRPSFVLRSSGGRRTPDAGSRPFPGPRYRK